MKKFELTAGFMTMDGVKLSRVRALRAFENVKKGDLGGYVEKEENLDQSGAAWVSGDAQVFGNAQVSGDVWEKSPLYIQGTKYSVCMSKRKTIKIGCQEHSIKNG